MAASGFNELDRLIGLIHVGHHHIGALGRRLHGKGLADAGGAAGDDDGALVKQMVLVHKEGLSEKGKEGGQEIKVCCGGPNEAIYPTKGNRCLKIATSLYSSR